MNYRHAFHAGNFADVLKHAVLVRILVHLRAKPAAFRVIDTHAGAGLYDLAGPEAGRSPEWRGGIAPAVDRSGRRGAARIARALSRNRRSSQQGRRTHALSGFARAGARIPARAGPADCLRDRAERRGRAGAQSRGRPALQGGRARRLDRAQRLRAAEGAARPRPDRSAIRGCGRFSAARTVARRRAPQMGGRHLPDVVSDQGSRRARRAGAAFAAQPASPRSCAPS